MTTSEPRLEASNLMYRRPELYDHARADPGGIVARYCTELIEVRGPGGARTILDVGCGTGLDLQRLAPRFDCVGIDIQPQMVAYANRVRPDLDVRVGDMRTFRLGHSVDTVLCLGNALAYLHADDDIHAAFDTFAAHSHAGTLLVVVTQTAPLTATQPASRPVDTEGLRGTVTLSYTWDAHTQINTTHRQWHLDDGTEHNDTIRRRVLNRQDLAGLATHTGFVPLDITGTPQAGSTGWFVARHPGPSSSHTPSTSR